MALMSSRVMAVCIAPWVLMTFSRICFNCFFFTRKSISGFNSLPGIVLSTKPRSWGMISLKRIRPTVVSTMPVISVPSAMVLDTRTLILA